ncbi:MAG: hypothetical protein C3F02_02510 [Parcubacteria group bacterium]|nr:MAG: hypothetical protein C3F02_02510 [Parcubacteria group bacterium]
MKISHSLAFSVVILVAVAAVFFWLDHSGNQSQNLRRVVKCRSAVIDQSVLDLDADTSLIGAFISFDRMPLATDTVDRLAQLGVSLDIGSQIFEISGNILAQIPTASLCDLSKLPAVQSIFIPEQNQADRADQLPSNIILDTGPMTPPAPVTE